MSKHITVILCTYNRSQSVACALESVARSVLPVGVDWEVLVVDNNSTDDTRSVVDSFVRKHPGRFRYLFEAQPGKSHALNAGIKDADANVLAFMDDDVIVEPTWLQNLTARLQSDTWAGVGGRILPPPDFQPPEWLALEGPLGMSGILAFFDLGPEAGELTQAPFGTNMAFRKSIFEKYGTFRTDLGPQPGSEIRGEDVEFAQRLFRAGERMMYEPSAVVHHAVPEKRRKQDYFLRFWFDHGRAEIRTMEARSPICGISRDYFSILNMAWLLACNTGRWLCTTDCQRRFYLKTRVWMVAGGIAEFYRRARRSRQQLATAAAEIQRSV